MKDLSKKLDLEIKVDEVINNTYKLMTTAITCIGATDECEKAIDFMIDIFKLLKAGVSLRKKIYNEETPLEETEIKITELEKGYEELRKTVLETIGKMI